jgi:hypothetical protein
MFNPAELAPQLRGPPTKFMPAVISRNQITTADTALRGLPAVPERDVHGINLCE